MNEVSQCIVNVINQTRTNRRGDPHSEAWREGLPVFVTGGGASCAIYRRAIDNAGAELGRKINSGGYNPYGDFRFIELNVDVGDIQSQPVTRVVGARISVAIGLTEEADSIARIEPFRDIPPITYAETSPPDHTQLYPK